MANPPAPDEPRVAHYLFAHRAVPRAFLRNPPEILGILASPDGTRFLDGMWDVLDKELEPEQRVERAGYKLEIFALGGGFDVALVTMPAPQRVFEAFFVALVARFDGKQSLARAFALELAGPPTNQPDTMICEWDVEGEYTVTDRSPAATADGFLNELEDLLKGA